MSYKTLYCLIISRNVNIRKIVINVLRVLYLVAYNIFIDFAFGFEYPLFDIYQYYNLPME